MASSDADPMDAIPPSEVPEMSDAGDLRGEDDQAPEGQHVAANSLMQMPTTPAGIRTLLGRKHRKRPLLCLKCKGCGSTTHDEDPFVKGDTVECLGLIHAH
jgi:hypothetical protein